MTSVDGLTELEPTQLAARLVSDLWTASNLSSGDRLTVLQLLSTRVGSANWREITRSWRLFQQAYDSALTGAVGAGAIEHRDEIIRRVNFLVLLANSVETVAESHELSSRARAIALEQAVLTFDEARRKASRWQLLPTTEMRDLRFLKNLFRPLQSLAPVDAESENTQEVGRWLSLLPSLP